MAGILDTFLITGDEESDESDRPARPGASTAQQTGSPFAYINMTEFNGEFEFQLRYVSLKNNDVLMTYNFRAACRDPLSNVQLVIPVPSVPRIKDTIAFELLCEGEVIGSQRIVVMTADEFFDDDDDAEIE